MRKVHNYPNPRMEWLRTSALNWNSDACLMWPFAVDKDGYGRVKNHGHESRSHRMIFLLANGRWPEPCALHSCDTPGCCNLRHIGEGTNDENQHQKAARGRSLRGVQQRGAKLTDDLVREIRTKYMPRRMGFHRLAKRYGVSKRLISLVITRHLWRHVA